MGRQVSALNLNLCDICSPHQFTCAPSTVYLTSAFRDKKYARMRLAACSLAAVSARFYPLWLELLAAPAFVLLHWAVRLAVEAATRRVLAPQLPPDAPSEPPHAPDMCAVGRPYV